MDATTKISNSVPNNIPEEIINEILSRLPAKSLLKFRCVCKSWNSLISSSQFAKTHLDLLSNSKDMEKHSVILSFCPTKFFTCSISSILTNIAQFPTDLDLPMELKICVVVGTCHGLLCALTASGSLILCNPTTKKFKKLTIQKEETRKYGFCYDKVNDDYKVVQLSDVWNDERGLHVTKAKVYSLRDNYWREMENFDDCLGFYRACQICVDGILHWSAYSSGKNWFILSVDTAAYVYNKVELPKYDEPPDALNWTLGEFGGCLGAIYQYNKERADIWRMKEYGVKESWIKLMSITYTRNMPRVHFPIFESWNGEVILNQNPYLMFYDIRNNSFRNLEICSNVGRPLSFPSLPPYIETLVRLSSDE